jgi:predicted glycogen debranching enzyme
VKPDPEPLASREEPEHSQHMEATRQMETPWVKNLYRVDRTRCQDLLAGRHLEWLITNGRGGFAMGAVSQMLTRRYHGLLVAAIDPPVERFVLLAKLEPSVTVKDTTYELSTNQYADVFHPTGCKLLESFSLRPHPTWRWRLGDVVLEQSLCMVEGEDATVVRYRLLEGGGPATIHVRPLCTSRHFHFLAHRPDLGEPEVEVHGDQLSLRWPGNRPSWRLSHNGLFAAEPDWYYRFRLSTEEERGYDSSQDLFVPGVISATLNIDDPTGLIVTAAAQDQSWKTWREAFAAAVSADRAEPPGPRISDPLAAPLLRAAKDFLAVRDGNLKTVLAGYPWFGDWGRDTFISLPGLCLVPRRFDDARRIILAFAKHVSEGMIPNRFPDFGEAPAYNTIDASLWYVQAMDRYLAYSGDWSFVADKMFAVVRDILAAHQQGTRHRIRLCDDGLLAGGEEGHALTWMDAKLPDHAVTPRIGKPVEINALWYNALRIAASFARRLGETKLTARWEQMAHRTRDAFNARFWNQAGGCLYDVVDADDRPGAADAAIRPNQLLAVSLTHPVLDSSRWPATVEACRRELWTPLGLRTLSPRDPAYRGRYAGDLQQRDAAYHQGTVWPWLLGPFVTAYVKAKRGASGRSSTSTPPPSATGGGSAALRPEAREARAFLNGLESHLNEDGVGSVCEVADGDPPHTPGGCPWQAWSVAEPLRALYEDIHGASAP